MNALEVDLSTLSDSELESKLQELSKKYFMAQRLGNHQLLTQIATFVNMYRDELSQRYRTKILKQDDRDLDQLINVD